MSVDDCQTFVISSEKRGRLNLSWLPLKSSERDRRIALQNGVGTEAQHQTCGQASFPTETLRGESRVVREVGYFDPWA